MEQGTSAPPDAPAEDSDGVKKEAGKEAEAAADVAAKNDTPQEASSDPPISIGSSAPADVLETFMNKLQEHFGAIHNINRSHDRVSEYILRITIPDSTERQAVLVGYLRTWIHWAKLRAEGQDGPLLDSISDIAAEVWGYDNMTLTQRRQLFAEFGRFTKGSVQRTILLWFDLVKTVELMRSEGP